MDKIQTGEESASEQSRAASESAADDNRLPIEEFKQTIIDMVKQRLFCIITGETGSGKSTQIAQFLLDGIGAPLDRLSEEEAVS